jgi:hypothetical protein
MPPMTWVSTYKIENGDRKATGGTQKYAGLGKVVERRAVAKFANS